MSRNLFLDKHLLDNNTYNTLINVIKRNIQVIPKEQSKRVNIEETSSRILEDILREYLKKSKYNKITRKEFEEVVNIALSKNRVLEKEDIQVSERIYNDLFNGITKFDYNKLKTALVYAIMKNKESQGRKR